MASKLTAADLGTMNQNRKPQYRPVKNDGATFKCCECGEQGEYHSMWHVTTPDGMFSGVYHKECVDPDWIEKAQFNPEPI